MLKSKKTEVAHIEFTSRCNLRCVYCVASQPHYRGIDLPREILKEVIEFLKERKFKAVCVSGQGETTIYKDWHLYCDELLEVGTPLHIITNFAKILSKDELETLTRFKSIDISCDTSDPDLFKKLRRGAKLENLITNLENLHSIGEKNIRKSPNISFSCVVTDKNIFNFKDYIKFGIQHGVKHFNFCNLTKYPDIKDGINPNHITEMSSDSMKKAYSILTKTFDFLKKSGIGYYVQQGLIDTIKEKIQLLNSGSERNNVQSKFNPHKEDQNLENLIVHRYSSKKSQLQTRDCLDPWSFFLIQSSGAVIPCCWHPPIGYISKGQSLDKILNNQQIQNLRKRLLTDNLPLDCTQCPSKSWTSKVNLKRRVIRYLHHKKFWKYFSQEAPLTKIANKNPYKIVYEDGWYGLEKNPNIKDSDWQTWRWIAKDALCYIKNPCNPSILIIRGEFNKKKFPDQNMIIKIGSQIIDEFTNINARFYKEYEIDTQTLGNSKNINLSLHTNRSFIPAKSDPGSKDNRELGLQIFEIYFGEIS